MNVRVLSGRPNEEELAAVVAVLAALAARSAAGAPGTAAGRHAPWAVRAAGRGGRWKPAPPVH